LFLIIKFHEWKPVKNFTNTIPPIFLQSQLKLSLGFRVQGTSKGRASMAKGRVRQGRIDKAWQGEAKHDRGKVE
jgi:hypothetical protein